MPETDIGRMLGRYRVTRRIGAGSMGEVFEGVDTVTEERVAIKILHAHLLSDPTFRERFEQEAHVTSLLQSPFTVRLHGYGIAGANAYLAMDFIDGPSVGDVLERDGRIETRRALGIALDVARALEEAAIRGVVHRDIKPSNILLSPDGHARLADFGIARRAQSTGMTLTGAYVGTIAYGAPEQQDGQVDHRSDIYALGATLYHMLCGHPPYVGSVGEVLRQHRDAPFPAAGLSDQPDEVVFLVRRCMPKDPADRIQTASELAAAIERTISLLSRGHHAAAPPPPAMVETRITQMPGQGGSVDETAVIAGPGTQAATAAMRVCPSCGVRNDLASRYCRTCGTLLPGQGEAPAAPTVVASRRPPEAPTAIVAPPPPPIVPAALGRVSAPRPPRDPWRVALVAVSMLTAVVAVVVVAVIVAVQAGDEGAQQATSTPADATPTPTRSVAPTATPRPGQAAYTNRFDTGSEVPAVNSGTARIEDGQLVLEHAATETSVAKISIPQPYVDVTVAVRALSTTDMIVLACRHRGANIQYRAYIKQSTQRFAIDLWNLEETDLVPWTTSTAIPKDSLANFAFTCKGPTLTLSVNGTTLTQVTNNVLTDGSVWIGLNGVQGEASSARFDDLVVSRQ